MFGRILKKRTKTQLKLPKKNLFILPWILISLVFVFVGLLTYLIGTYTGFDLKNNSFSTEKSIYGETIGSINLTPQKVIIPAISLMEDIVEGGVDNNGWVISSDKVYYLPQTDSNSSRLGIVLYAYNKPDLFLNIRRVLNGDLITINDNSGNLRYYSVYSVENTEISSLNKYLNEVGTNLLLLSFSADDSQSVSVVKAKSEEVTIYKHN